MRLLPLTGLRRYSQGVPRPKGLPLIGTMLDLMSAGGGPKLHLYVDCRHQQLGPIFTESLGPVTATFVADPKDMRRVFAAEGKHPVHLLPDAWLLYNKLYSTERGLFFMDGEEWLKYRHIMNKILFKTEPSEGVRNAYATATNALVNEWAVRTDINRPIEDIVNHMYRLSISYVIASLLGSSYPSHTKELMLEVDRLSSVACLIFEESTKLNLLPAKMAATLRLPVWRRFVSAVESSLEITNKLVNRLLPLASDDGILQQMAAEGVEHKKMVSIVVDLILAGADTTPYTMVWALYLLGRNPEIQNQVAAELGRSSAEQRMSHPLLRAVMRETLRLYPAAPFVTRALASDTELSGYRVPAGEMIIMSLYTSGRSNLYFPNAEKFWPQRWLRDPAGDYFGVKDPTASLPFAMGGRACIGRRVAEALISLTLAEILTRFQVKVTKEIDMVLMLVPVPAEPVSLFLSTR